MLKKAGHIIISLLLLAGTGGVTISKHYCGDTLVGRSVFSVPKDCCGSSCKDCRNETKTYRITDTFEFTDAKIAFHCECKQLSDTYNLFVADLLQGFRHTPLADHSPPIIYPLIVQRPAGDPEAFLQRFLL